MVHITSPEEEEKKSPTRCSTTLYACHTRGVLEESTGIPSCPFDVVYHCSYVNHFAVLELLVGSLQVIVTLHVH